MIVSYYVHNAHMYNEPDIVILRLIVNVVLSQ